MSNRKHADVKRPPAKLKEVYSIATGSIMWADMRSSNAARFLMSQDGFINAQALKDTETGRDKATLFYYKSEIDAKVARKVAQLRGVLTGDHVVCWTADEKGNLSFSHECR